MAFLKRWLSICMCLPTFLAASRLPAVDCNNNGTEDAIDISSGTSQDCDGNQVPDECFVVPPELTFRVAARFPVGESPNAIVAAHLDQDEILDLVVTNIGTEDVSILLGKGDGSFHAQQTFNAVRPSLLISADFDGNTVADLAFINGFTDEISIYLGRGDGSFQAGQKFVPSESTADLLAAHVDADGAIDLVSVDGISNRVYVFPGQGDGTFGAGRSFAVGERPRAVVSAKINDDDFMDLVTANCDSNDLSVLYGTSTGTFRGPVSFPVPQDPRALVAEDLNSDGLVDLAVTSSNIPRAGREVAVFLALGDGDFRAFDAYTVGRDPRSIVAADVSADGILDLITRNIGQGSQDLSVLLGNGDGTFQPEMRYLAGSMPTAMVAVDLNADQMTDLAVVNGSSEDVTVLLSQESGILHAPRQFTVPGANVLAVDLNADGIADVGVSGNDASRFCVLPGNGDGTFKESEECLTIDSSRSGSVVVADFNGDEINDLVAVDASERVAVSLGREDGSFSPPRFFDVQFNVGALDAGDFDGDEIPDLAVAISGHLVTVFSGLGDGDFVETATSTVGSQPFAIIAADFNDDGRLDVAIASTSDGDVSILLGRGDGSFQEPLKLISGPKPYALASADFDQNGVADLAVVDFNVDDVSVFLSKSEGGFDGPEKFPTGAEPVDVVTADLNLDGLADVVTVNNRSDDIALFLGHGDGTFAPAQRIPVGDSPRSVAVADLDDDGVPDFVTAQSAARAVAVIRQTSQLSFDCNENGIPEVCELLNGSITDTDGDGTPDTCERGRQVPGDCSQNGVSDLSDAVCLLGALFLGEPTELPCGDGSFTDPANLRLLDMQPDGGLDCSDAVAWLQFQFHGGPRHPLALPGREGWGCVSIAGCPSSPVCR